MKWFTEYKNSLKMIELEEVPDIIFYRPLASLLIKLIYPTRITPNQISLAAIVIALAGGYLYSLGTQRSCVSGAFLYLLFNILDCSDGQLARLKKNGTLFGSIIDGISDYIAAIAIFTGIAFGYTNKPDQSSFFLILLILSGICIIVQEALVDYYRTRFMDYVLERKNNLTESIEKYKNEHEILKNQKNIWFDKAIISIYMKYINMQNRLVAEKEDKRMFHVSSRDYYNKNRKIIRFWVFMGPSAKITTLIVCSLLYRFDIYFWIILVFFNAFGAVLWIRQQYIDNYLLNLNP